MFTYHNCQDEAKKFLGQVAELLKAPQDIEQAFNITIAVLHTLRDRITLEESLHLVSNLPILLKGIYFDGWHRKHQLTPVVSMEDFLEEIKQHAPEYIGRDFARNQLTVEKARAVISVLRNYVSASGFWHVRNQLPNAAIGLFNVEL